MNESIRDLNLSPARIYVLWHPGFDNPPEFEGRSPASLTPEEKKRLDRGLKLARQIYHWFRVENMEGIPVYFRCSEKPLPICDDDVRINYIIPLVDANMVASPVWRSYVTGLRGGNGSANRLLPVAVEAVAYNMPEAMRKLNFIRHDLNRDSPEVLISRLTEVMCRDLRNFVRKPTLRDGGDKPAPPDKLRIFLSHAKADLTREAVALKKYLQEETQCEAFFDETDIASGYDYADVLGNAIEDESAGLVVIQGDHYADRPWCRREIRDFLQPVGDPPVKDDRTSVLFIPPVVVVQTMQGKRIARNIADLGHAPCVRWQEGAARFVITTLLREILFGLFYRLLARGLVNHAPVKETVFINRTPDPVMVSRILVACGNFPPKVIAHPGYGLSSLERSALKEDFPALDFTAFSQIPREPGIDGLPDLTGRVICVSAGNAPDIMESGLCDEHNQELLQRLLRPLFLKQVSLIYGGRMPQVIRPLDPWNQPVNFTGVFLELLLSERASGWKGTTALSRLYNLSPWPDHAAITPQVIAQWTDICSFLPVTLKEADIDKAPEPPADPDPAEMADLDREERISMRKQHADETAKHEVRLAAAKARCLTAMRAKACKPIKCPLPDGPHAPVPFETLAHLFVGGKITGASGIIPGIFEEILFAFDAGKPVFVIGSTHGAAGFLAGWLAAPPPVRPQELTIEFYLTSQKMKAVYEELGGAPAQSLDRLWNYIQKAETDLPSLLNNRLDDTANRQLLDPNTGCSEICQRIWQGLAELHNHQSRPA